MNEGGNCPVGTQYDSKAPWNIEDLPDKEFDVTCSQSLSKTVTIFTNDYVPIVEKEYDEDGCTTFVDYDTPNTNWESEYHNNEHYTPIQLIELFQKYLLDEVNGSNTISRNPKYLNHLISECNNWNEDETVIMKEQYGCKG